MRVFVTGATGWVGSTVTRDLRAAGHTVLGMARSDAGAEALRAEGVEVHRGELTDIESLVAGAKACDGVIHTAFIHDFSKFAENIEIDRRAVDAMAAALEGTGKPFVISSGAAIIANGKLGVETDEPGPGAMRGASEDIVREAAGRGVRSSAIRLSPTVHGAGDHGFVPQLIAIARAKGFAAYVGDGANRWPAVHRLDAARLYCLAFEKGAPGARYHGVAEEGIAMRAIAETIGAGLGLPVRSLTPEEAAAHFGFFARFAAMDLPTSSAITREALGWLPREPELLADMKANYFG